LLLSQHFLKHYYSRLIWLEDIYRLVRNRDQEFWRKLSNRAYRMQQTKPLSYSLYLLKEYYDFETPPGSGMEEPAGKISTIERTFLRMTAQEMSIRFGLENLFPGQEIMKSEFGTVMGRNRALFYPWRLFKTLVLILEYLLLRMGLFMGKFCKRFF
jgi:hypothetical protein